MLHRSFRFAAAVIAVFSASGVFAQDALPQPDLDHLMHGALVYHGNYCGPGNKGVRPAPIDALDAACMRHDACVKDFEIPSCGCNDRLAEEANAVVADLRAPAEEREAAEFTARGVRTLPCR